MAYDVIGRSQEYVWDTNLLEWVKMVQPVIDGGSITISGSISVSNFPAVQHVIVDSGTLTSITNTVVISGAVLTL